MRHANAVEIAVADSQAALEEPEPTKETLQEQIAKQIALEIEIPGQKQITNPTADAQSPAEQSRQSQSQSKEAEQQQGSGRRSEATATVDAGPSGRFARQVAGSNGKESYAA